MSKYIYIIYYIILYYIYILYIILYIYYIYIYIYYIFYIYSIYTRHMCNSSRSSTCHAMPCHAKPRREDDAGNTGTVSTGRCSLAAAPFRPPVRHVTVIHHGHRKSPSNCHLNRFKSATNVDFPVSVSHVWLKDCIWCLHMFTIWSSNLE